MYTHYKRKACGLGGYHKKQRIITLIVIVRPRKKEEVVLRAHGIWLKHGTFSISINEIFSWFAANNKKICRKIHCTNTLVLTTFILFKTDTFDISVRASFSKARRNSENHIPYNTLLSLWSTINTVMLRISARALALI